MIIRFFKTIFHDFFSLIYPRICPSCENSLLKNDLFLCTNCSFELPKTKFHNDKDNFVNQLFWGRVQLENATAYYYFIKKSKFQKLIHKLKYKGNRQIGFELGRLLGLELVESGWYKGIDFIVPVPLHPKREKKRGYNQSYWIAKGVADAMYIAVNNKNLYRSVETETQTRKSRTERWENVESIFKLKNDSLFEDKHILLIDDVVTTGSTLEACANTLLLAKNSKVSIATLAVSYN